jgi:ABC-2 type transport system permease protein
VIGSLRAEWLKARKRPAVYVLLAVLLGVLVLLFYFLLWYLFTYRAQEILRGSPPGVRAQDIKQLLYPQHFLQEMLSAARQIGGPICLILGVQMAGSDYGWGTWKTVFTQRPPRLVVWAAKVTVMLVLIAIGTVLFVAVAAGCWPRWPRSTASAHPGPASATPCAPPAPPG